MFTRSRSVLALFALSLAPMAPAFAADQIQIHIRTGASGINYGAGTASAQACGAGSAGDWVEANGVALEGAERRITLSFSKPLATDTLRAAMNGAGARKLMLVEIAGTDGVWHKAWEGRTAAPAPGLEPTCFEQLLPQKQVVGALRFTFRPSQDEIAVDHAALLRR